MMNHNALAKDDPSVPPENQAVLPIVDGVAVQTLPEDLYIPPEALRVLLDTFQGPLDLLLYLIKKQNLDILDIPVAKITEQYMAYIDLMQELKLELAAEYLLMAAMLAEIKSRILLPRPVDEEGEEEDPRAALIQRLQEYERFKEAAESLYALPQMERDLFQVNVQTPDVEDERPQPAFEMADLFSAFQAVMARVDLTTAHQVRSETLSIRERMTEVLERVRADDFTPFAELFVVKEGKLGVVVTFVAILELLRQATIEMVQSEPYAPIYIKAVGE